MNLPIIILVPILLLSPHVVVQWVHQGSAVNIELSSVPEEVTQCVQSGLEVRSRFEVKVCAKADFWFDDCSKLYRETRMVQYDAVSESYQVTRDVHSDEVSPDTRVVASMEEALKSLSALDNLALERVSGEASEFMKQPKAYLSVLVKSSCLDEERSLSSQIPYYLMFGLVRFSGYSSGWVDFALE